MSHTAVYRTWLDSETITDAERSELAALEEEEIKARFFAPLSFGTAGLRGVMGAGLHRMNAYVVRQATQALANIIKAEGKAAMTAGVIIGYDCRENSEKFACEAACVMAANGIFVKLFSRLCPTPQVSFAIRRYKAVAGINITASHNPREYNGYKVYWSDGAQLPPQHADRVAAAMDDLDIFNGAAAIPFEQAEQQGYIKLLSSETDRAFLDCVLAQRVFPHKADSELKVVYTPFHGAGHALVPQALQEAGYRNIIPVAEQAKPDGTFPTVKSPNPENIESFELAIETAGKHGADIIIGTDPDADRVGVVLRGSKDRYISLSGNQIGVLLTDYLIRARRETGVLPSNACVITTIVSTLMIDAVCKEHGVDIFRTFTGFKFIAGKMEEHKDTHELLIGFEESFGYMAGDFCRDKDAVTASLLIAEMADWYARQGMTLYEAMTALYEQYGYYTEKTINLVMPGLDGLEKMKALMRGLRDNPPAEIAGTAVSVFCDYLPGTRSTAGGAAEALSLSGSDVLSFEMSDGVTFLIRPSGTEPKVKLYILSPRSNIDAYTEYAKGLGG
jgi:phosphoglucomutase